MPALREKVGAPFLALSSKGWERRSSLQLCYNQRRLIGRYRLGVRTEDSQSFSGSATTPTALILLKVSFGSLWVTLREWVKNG